jgi:hypothetical protein
VTPEQLTALGQHAEREAEALLRHLERLATTPATQADVLLGRLRPGIDFARFDALLRELDAACRKNGAFTFTGLAGTHSLAGVRALLIDALVVAEPYREKTRA